MLRDSQQNTHKNNHAPRTTTAVLSTSRRVLEGFAAREADAEVQEGLGARAMTLEAAPTARCQRLWRNTATATCTGETTAMRCSRVSVHERRRQSTTPTRSAGRDSRRSNAVTQHQGAPLYEPLDTHTREQTHHTPRGAGREQHRGEGGRRGGQPRRRRPPPPRTEARTGSRGSATGKEGRPEEPRRARRIRPTS